MEVLKFVYSRKLSRSNSPEEGRKTIVMLA